MVFVAMISYIDKAHVKNVDSHQTHAMLSYIDKAHVVIKIKMLTVTRHTECYHTHGTRYIKLNDPQFCRQLVLVTANSEQVNKK